MKLSKYSALDDLEDLLSRLRPGAEVTMDKIIETIKPQYRDAETISTAVMLLQKYEISIEKGE